MCYHSNKLLTFNICIKTIYKKLDYVCIVNVWTYPPPPPINFAALFISRRLYIFSYNRRLYWNYICSYTVRQFNWWCYCSALCDEIFDHFPVFDQKKLMECLWSRRLLMIFFLSFSDSNINNVQYMEKFINRSRVSRVCPQSCTNKLCAFLL